MSSEKWKVHGRGLRGWLLNRVGTSDVFIDFMKDFIMSAGEKKVSKTPSKYRLGGKLFVSGHYETIETTYTIPNENGNPYYKASFNWKREVNTALDLVDSNEPLEVYEEIGRGGKREFSRRSRSRMWADFVPKYNTLIFNTEK